MTGLDWLVSRMSPSCCGAKLRAHSKRARVKLFVPLSSSAEGLPEEKQKKKDEGDWRWGEKKIKWRTGRGIKSGAAARKERKDERTDVKICSLFVSGGSLSRPRALLQRSQRGDLKAYPVRETVSPRSHARKKKHRETAGALGNRSPPFPLKWTARNIKKNR